MATPYSRTLRSLEAESTRGAIAWVAVISLLLAAGIVWSFVAEVGVIASSTEARIETTSAATRWTPRWTGGSPRSAPRSVSG